MREVTIGYFRIWVRNRRQWASRAHRTRRHAHAALQRYKCLDARRRSTSTRLVAVSPYVFRVISYNPSTPVRWPSQFGVAALFNP